MSRNSARLDAGSPAQVTLLYIAYLILRAEKFRPTWVSRKTDTVAWAGSSPRPTANRQRPVFYNTVKFTVVLALAPLALVAVTFSGNVPVGGRLDPPRPHPAIARTSNNARMPSDRAHCNLNLLTFFRATAPTPTNKSTTT